MKICDLVRSVTSITDESKRGIVMRLFATAPGAMVLWEDNSLTYESDIEVEVISGQ